MFLFVILFGLSMDYHVFILSRVREAFDRGMKTEDAVAHGIRTTAGTVTSAAVVMVAVFGIFATLSYLDFKMMGVGLATAILVDATLVRAVLLPATMKLLGDWNWYLPRWLEWMPSLGHEATVAAPAPVSVTQPAGAGASERAAARIAARRATAQDDDREPAGVASNARSDAEGVRRGTRSRPLSDYGSSSTRGADRLPSGPRSPRRRGGAGRRPASATRGRRRLLGQAIGGERCEVERGAHVGAAAADGLVDGGDGDGTPGLPPARSERAVRTCSRSRRLMAGWSQERGVGAIEIGVVVADRRPGACGRRKAVNYCGVSWSASPEVDPGPALSVLAVGAFSRHRGDLRAGRGRRGDGRRGATCL